MDITADWRTQSALSTGEVGKGLVVGINTLICNFRGSFFYTNRTVSWENGPNLSFVHNFFHLYLLNRQGKTHGQAKSPNQNEKISIFGFFRHKHEQNQILKTILRLKQLRIKCYLIYLTLDVLGSFFI